MALEMTYTNVDKMLVLVNNNFFFQSYNIDLLYRPKKKQTISSLVNLYSLKCFDWLAAD